MGATEIAALTAVRVDSDTRAGPDAWVGHAVERWSLTLAQHGQIFQFGAEYEVEVFVEVEGLVVGAGLMSWQRR